MNTVAKQPCDACDMTHHDEDEEDPVMSELGIGWGDRLVIRQARDGCLCLVCDPCAHGVADEWDSALQCFFGREGKLQGLDLFCHHHGVELTAQDMRFLRRKSLDRKAKVKHLKYLSSVFEPPHCGVHRTNWCGVNAQTIARYAFGHSDM